MQTSVFVSSREFRKVCVVANRSYAFFGALTSVDALFYLGGRKMLKRVFAMLLAFTVLFMLGGCDCKHEWNEASCTEPKTCELCGETEGEPIGHRYSDGYCLECGAEDPSYINLNMIGFQRTYNMNKWLPITGYDPLKNIVFTTVADIENYAGRIFSNGYVYLDWRNSEGVPKNAGSEPIAYTCTDNNNILLSNGCSYNITDRVVVGNAVVIKTMYYRTNKSDIELWFVPYDMIDWSKGTYRNENNRICYTIK